MNILLLLDWFIRDKEREVSLSLDSRNKKQTDMKYLIVSNMGEIPLWGMTHIGISLARDQADKIGQFGSGAKHGILVALRAGLEIKIFSGMTEIIPKFQPVEGAEEHEELVFFINGVARHTSMTKGFGDIDWKNDVQLALREFFSNAIDQGETPEGCYSVSEDPKPIEGMTQVILEFTGDVQNFINNLSEWYVSQPPNSAFRPTTSNNGLCYLKGVKIGQIAEDCMFNYNFSDIELNESRQVSESNLRYAATRQLTLNVKTLEKIFRSFHIKSFETVGINSYNVTSRLGADNLKTAWKVVHGDAVPVLQADVEFFAKKKIPYVLVTSPWYEVLNESHLQLGYIKADQTFEQKHNFAPATKRMHEQLDRAWNILSECSLTDGKSKPEVGAFTQIMSEGRLTMGMMHKGKVYFNLDEEPGLITALEELTHYVTEAGDETRDFQDFTLRLASKLALKLDL